MKALLFVALLTFCGSAVAGSPGAVDPLVMQSNIKSTVCVSGYAAQVRPPTSYTNKLKALLTTDEDLGRACVHKKIALRKNPSSDDWVSVVNVCAHTYVTSVDQSLMAKYELDHKVPLAVGGHPYSIDNLELEPWPEAKIKDKLETSTHKDLCASKITLKQAQAKFKPQSTK